MQAIETRALQLPDLAHVWHSPSKQHHESSLGCRNWRCNIWGFKGCVAALPAKRPFPAFLALSLPFLLFFGGSEDALQHLENPENAGKTPFSSDIPGFA